MKLQLRDVILLALCVAVLCSCGQSSPVIRPDPPKVKLDPLPVDKMAAPDFGKRARARFLTPSATPTTPTAGSAGSSPN